MAAHRLSQRHRLRDPCDELLRAAIGRGQHPAEPLDGRGVVDQQVRDPEAGGKSQAAVVEGAQCTSDGRRFSGERRRIDRLSVDERRDEAIGVRVDDLWPDLQARRRCGGGSLGVAVDAEQLRVATR